MQTVLLIWLIGTVLCLSLLLYVDYKSGGKVKLFGLVFDGYSKGAIFALMSLCWPFILFADVKINKK